MSPKNTLSFILLSSLILITSLGVTVLAVGGVEFNLIYTQPSPDYLGGIGIYVVPLNVSDPSLLQSPSLYVIDIVGIPRYSYVFSNLPPLIFFLEQSLGVTSYSAYYGGTNPYSGFIASPGTPQSIWGAFDDFDYTTGFWVSANASLSGGKYVIQPQGYIALNTPYAQDFVHTFLILGSKAFMIQLNVSNGWVTVNLTSKEFGDWNLIVDGNDIYFLNPDATPLYYSIIYLSKTDKVLTFAVELKNSDTIFMLYGGTNPYASYRVS